MLIPRGRLFVSFKFGCLFALLDVGFASRLDGRTPASTLDLLTLQKRNNIIVTIEDSVNILDST